MSEELTLSSLDIEGEVTKALERLQGTLPAHSQEVINTLSEIMRADMSEFICDEDGIPVIPKGKGHLIKRYEVTETFRRNGDRVVKTKIEGWDKLNAISQLRDVFNIKGEARQDKLFRLMEMAYKLMERARGASISLTFQEALAEVKKDAEIILNGPHA